MDETGIPFGDLPRDQQDAEASKCTSSDCLAAKADVTRLRNEIRSSCFRAQAAYRNFWDGFKAHLFFISMALLFAIGSLVAVVTVIAAVISIIFLVFGGIFVLFWLGAIIYCLVNKSDYDKALAEVDRLQKQQIAAIQKVQSSCGQYCMGNLTITACVI